MILPWGDLIGGVAKIADDLITTDEERAKMALEDRKIDAQLLQGQIETNKVEAAHPSLFVAGWRPAIGWIGAAALGYQFLAYPLLIWAWALLQARAWVPAGLQPPPMLDTDALWVVLSGMLGIAGLRTAEKVKGVARG